MNVADGRSELGDVVELTSLTWRVTIGARVENVCKRFVISEDVEQSTFEKMTEVFYSEVYSQQFTVECAVSGFCRCQFA